MKLKIKLFDVYIFLIALLKGVGLNSADVLYVLAFALGCIVILLKMFHEKYTLKEFIPLVLIVGIGLLDYIYGKTTTVLFTAITICGLKNVDVKRAIKISFWVRFVAFFVILVVYGSGLLEQNPLLFLRNGVYLVRFDFGYGHPNIAHFMLATLVLQGLYLYGSGMKGIHYVAVFVINYIFYNFTYSRTGFIATTLSLIVFYLIKKPRIEKLMMSVGRFAYVIGLVFTIITALYFGESELIDELNDLMTGRIYYNNLLIKSFTPPVFGSSIYSTYTIIDNGFMVLLYEGGIIAFVWFTYHIMKLCNKYYREGQSDKLALLICFICFNLTESFLISVSVNISLLFIQDTIFSNKEVRLYESTDNIYSDL